MAEGEWHRAWRDLWTFADKPQVGDVMYVLALFAAGGAVYVAQDHKLHALPTAAWTVGVGIVALVAFRIAIFAVTKHRAPKVQRNEARDEVGNLLAQINALTTERGDLRSKLEEAERRQTFVGGTHYHLHEDPDPAWVARLQAKDAQAQLPGPSADAGRTELPGGAQAQEGNADTEDDGGAGDESSA